MHASVDYAIIRVVPRVELINVGIIVSCPTRSSSSVSSCRPADRYVPR